MLVPLERPDFTARFAKYQKGEKYYIWSTQGEGKALFDKMYKEVEAAKNAYYKFVKEYEKFEKTGQTIVDKVKNRKDFQGMGLSHDLSSIVGTIQKMQAWIKDSPIDR